MNKINTIKKTFLPIFSACLLSACGKADKAVSDNDQMIQEAEDAAARAASDGSNIQGTYIAKFQTLNPHVNGTIPGSAQLRRTENKLSAFVRLFAGSPSVAHFQNVHMGNRCPTLSDDSNGDGYIDIQEAYSVVGPIVIPLDWDIGSQHSANRSWPKAFPNGSYEYMQSTSFSHFWSDLKSSDKDPNDKVAKLEPDQGLAITGRVVMIQGVGTDKTLPATVAGLGKWQNHQTLPIVCGVFFPAGVQPASDYSEQIPGPVASVEEGQDRPAPEGAGEIPGTGTVIIGPSNSAGSNTSGNEDDRDRGSSGSGGSTGTAGTGDEGEAEDGGFCWPWESDCRN